MSWLSKAFSDTVDEAKRTPKNLVAIARNPLGSLVTGVSGLFAGKKGAARGPRFVGPVDHPFMTDMCRAKRNGVIVDQEEVIYDYKLISAAAQTAAGLDIFDDTVTTNITEGRKLPKGLYKSVAVTIELNNAADSLGMVQDAILRVKSGKNGDIVLERALMDCSDFVLTDTVHGVIVRQDGVHAEDLDLVVTDEDALNYFNILFPSLPTFTGTPKLNVRLRKFPMPDGIE